MNLNDIAAIRAVRTAYAMHMPDRVHPMSEHGHNRGLKPHESNGKEPQRRRETKQRHSSGHWIAGDIEEQEEHEEGGESANEDSSDEEQNLGDEEESDDEDDEEEVDQGAIKVLRAALLPISSPHPHPSRPLPQAFTDLSLQSHVIVDNEVSYQVIGRGTCGTIYSNSSLSAPKIGRDEKALRNDICLGKEVHDA